MLCYSINSAKGCICSKVTANKLMTKGHDLALKMHRETNMLTCSLSDHFTCIFITLTFTLYFSLSFQSQVIQVYSVCKAFLWVSRTNDHVIPLQTDPTQCNPHFLEIAIQKVHLILQCRNKQKKKKKRHMCGNSLAALCN